MKGNAILLSSDSYAALHLIMTRFWPEFRSRVLKNCFFLVLSLCNCPR